MATELLPAYDITTVNEGPEDFFGRELGSIDYLDPNILSPTDPIVPGLSNQTHSFLGYLSLISRGDVNEESIIVDFTRSILQVTGFVDYQSEHTTVLRSYYEIPLTIRGDSRLVAETNICLVDFNPMILLLVLATTSQHNSEHQVLTGAIAVFQHNNQKRADLNLPVLDEMTIPCIMMVGTRPVFYQIPVTQQLSDFVVTGQSPPPPIVIRHCAPPLHRATDGMEVLEYRRVALQYFDAFRDLARTCWTVFSQDHAYLQRN